MSDFEYLVVGGGLQGGLLALAIRACQPDARVALVERDPALGGNHTWCFHEGDVPEGARDWLAPLVVRSWPAYDVVFPGLTTTIDQAYSAVTSDRLDEVVSAAVRSGGEDRLFLGTPVAEVSDRWIRTSAGAVLRAEVVIDARGPVRPARGAPAGYQKFVGREVELAREHGLDRPILMDTLVDQSQGFHFMYVLPFDERMLLVEDTYFHEDAHLDATAARAEIDAYLARRGWTAARVVREESGVLPMPWAGTFSRRIARPLAAGYRGGWFHPGTGYSFPVALRLAHFVASRPPSALFGPDLDHFAVQHARQVRFAELLNRLLFRWYPPRRRRGIFERVYGLPRSTIGNFYALRMRGRDASRLILGRPPAGLSLRYRLRGSAER